MLSDKFSYVAVDFETTGLDRKKDEPIQIGIVKCDAKGNVLDAYVSYIKPKKDIKDLKQQVTLITGLSLDDVAKAPERELVYDEIKKYFDSSSVLIGHNVEFDIAFLKKHWEEFDYAGSIDTYPLSQAVVHFYKSYALEAVTQAVYKDADYQKIYNRIKLEVETLSKMKSHDALYDSVQSAAFFFWSMDRIAKLAAIYPGMAGCVAKTDGIYGQILQHWPETVESSKISFPLMQRPLIEWKKPSPTAVLKTDIHEDKYCVSQLWWLKWFLEYTAKNKVLLSFSHSSKLDIAKNILMDLGYKNLWFLKEDQYIDTVQFERRLNKKILNESEFLFCLKYLSQLQKWYSVIDIKTPSDRNILHTIKKVMPYNPWNIVLCSHGWLYALLEWKLGLGTDWLKDYTIVYCDVEWWYTSYNNFANSDFDLYSLLELLETYAYKYRFREESMKDVWSKQTAKLLDEAISSLSMFIAFFIDEVTESFKKISHYRVNMEPILWQPQFYRSSSIWEQFAEKAESVISLLSDTESTTLKSNFDKLSSLLQSVVKVEKKLTNDATMYFTLAHEVNFTDYSEFLALFAWKNLMLASHVQSENWYKVLHQTNNAAWEQTSLWFPMIEMSDKSDVDFHIKERKDKNKKDPVFFILSSKKHISKAMLDFLYKEWYHREYDILVDNITGGIGKNTMRAAKPGAKILIWWYHFLLNLFAYKQSIDICFVLDIDWPLKQQILIDIQWYGWSTKTA